MGNACTSSDSQTASKKAQKAENGPKSKDEKHHNLENGQTRIATVTTMDGNQDKDNRWSWVYSFNSERQLVFRIN